VLSLFRQPTTKNRKGGLIAQIPKNKYRKALAKLLNAYSEQEQQAIFEYHLAALPGWTGYIKS